MDEEIVSFEEALALVSHFRLTQDDSDSFHDENRPWSFALESAASDVQAAIERAVTAERARVEALIRTHGHSLDPGGAVRATCLALIEKINRAARQAEAFESDPIKRAFDGSRQCGTVPEHNTSSTERDTTP